MIEIHESHEQAAQAVADLIVDHVAAHPTTNIALSGGSTPAAVYAELVSRPVDWAGVTLWLGDERWVPADHPDSNAAMVRDTLGAAADRLLAPDYTLGDPEEAAAAYEVALTNVCAADDREGRPHLVLLGMGDDGHTASLFPGTTALAVRDRNYVANWLPVKGIWRLTATLPLLRSAHQVVFLVTGAAKATMLRRILTDGDPFPAGLVAQQADNVTWILDEPAAASL